MLEEREVGPAVGGLRRRCFRGDWLEAMLTYDSAAAVAIVHITYLAPYRGVFVLRWSPADGYNHYRIAYESGGAETVTCPDAECYGGEVPDGFDREEMRGRIYVGNARLEPEIRTLLLRTVKAYPRQLRRCRFCKERRPADCQCRDCGKRACIPCVHGDAFLGGPCAKRTLHDWRGIE